MYERMLNKQIVPTEDDIKKHIGEKAVDNMNSLLKIMKETLEADITLRFPYGKEYGWSYKASKKSKHLFDLFFEKGSISAFLQINKIETEKEIAKYNKLSEEGKEYWKNKYPCGKTGGWIDYRITNKKQLKDVGVFISIKSNKEIMI